MPEEKISTIDLVEDLLLSLNDGIVCTDEDNDMEGASHQMHSMEDALCELLPKMGIYAWICDDISYRSAEIYASEDEAEKAIARDIKDIGNVYGFDMIEAEVADYGHSLLLSDGTHDSVVWKRFYEKENEQ